jgi:hypothetical protein
VPIDGGNACCVQSRTFVPGEGVEAPKSAFTPAQLARIQVRRLDCASCSCSCPSLPASPSPTHTLILSYFSTHHFLAPDRCPRSQAAVDAAASSAELDRIQFFVQQNQLPPELRDPSDPAAEGDAAGAGAGAGAGAAVSEMDTM